MKYSFRCLVIGLALGAGQITLAQQNRIPYNNQKLFLSGANLAWVDFAEDIGPGTDTTIFGSFKDVLLQMHDHGGNALRWWLHTNGTVTPQFDSRDFVIGLGNGTIDDMKEVLRIAKEREIGLILCLWSFDMLRKSGERVLTPDIRHRNRLLLSDSAYTHAYIDSCLVPMVKALKGDSAIIAWEIFNEPEWMSDTLGGDFTEHVPMAAIQRFINLCAGAIHRTDSLAQVTCGARNFSSLANISALSFFNYYSDSCLVAAGGDTAGKLDFYSVHYYPKWGRPLSPFHYPANWWGLDKPIVVAEFSMEDTHGILKEDLFKTLFQTDYAGALPWSWSDTQYSDTYPDMLAGMKCLWDNYRTAVDVNGIGGDWPVVNITSPTSDTEFPDGALVKIEATASDNDGAIAIVEFFASDTLKIGETNTAPYTITWTNITPGIYKLTAIAADNAGHKRTSNCVPIKVGKPKITRLEAERAAISGTPFIINDPTASYCACLRMKQDGTITWNFSDVPKQGSYEILFRYRLSFDTPKYQFINVNGVRADTVIFDGAKRVWLEKKLYVNLDQGNNVVQMKLWYGFMDLDYLDVSSIVTSVEGPSDLSLSFSLQQNYPNPFNPSTTIRFSVPQRGQVTLKVFDVNGREVATLVDGNLAAGKHVVTFAPRETTTGLYFYKITAGKFSQTRKAVLLK